MDSQFENLRSKLINQEKAYTIFQLDDLPGAQPLYWQKLPFSIRVLLEGVLRNINHET